MYFRLFVPSLLALGAGALAAGVTKAAQQAPGPFGLASLYSNVPAWLLAAGIAVAVAIAVAQLIRLRLWERGVVGACYVCGCLLGAPRAARRGLGTTRKCMGCGKVHGTNHRLSPTVVPLAVAVKDGAGAPVRSVRSSP
jgi:hypothetical protein